MVEKRFREIHERIKSSIADPKEVEIRNKDPDSSLVRTAGLVREAKDLIVKRPGVIRESDVGRFVSDSFDLISDHLKTTKKMGPAIQAIKDLLVLIRHSPKDEIGSFIERSKEIQTLMKATLDARKERLQERAEKISAKREDQKKELQRLPDSIYQLSEEFGDIRRIAKLIRDSPENRDVFQKEALETIVGHAQNIKNEPLHPLVLGPWLDSSNHLWSMIQPIKEEHFDLAMKTLDGIRDVIKGLEYSLPRDLFGDYMELNEEDRQLLVREMKSKGMGKTGEEKRTK